MSSSTRPGLVSSRCSRRRDGATAGGQWLCRKLTIDAPWRDTPERCASWKTYRERLHRWQADGTWDRILAAVQPHDDGEPVAYTVHITPTASASTSTPPERGKGAPRSTVLHLAGRRERSRPAPARRSGALAAD